MPIVYYFLLKSFVHHMIDILLTKGSILKEVHLTFTINESCDN